MSFFQLDRALANGLIRVREVTLSPTPSAGLVNNLDGLGAPVIKVTGPAADFRLTGLVAPAGSPRNASCLLWNATAVKLTLAVEDTASSGVNRFANSRIIDPGEIVELYYSDNDARWYAVGENLLATANIWSSRQDIQSDVVVGPAGLLADNATSGFIHLSATNGPPTGVPSPDTGKIPVVFDTLSWSFWFRDASHSSGFQPHRGFRPYNISSGGTQTLDFNYDAATVTMNGGTTTFVTANKFTGRRMIVEINCAVSAANLVWPSGWRWFNAAPSSIAANKSALLEIWSWTASDTGVMARWNVQP